MVKIYIREQFFLLLTQETDNDNPILSCFAVEMSQFQGSRKEELSLADATSWDTMLGLRERREVHVLSPRNRHLSFLFIPLVIVMHVFHKRFCNRSCFNCVNSLVS